MLSDRIRPYSEAAPWVIEEVKQLEKERDELKTELATAKGLLEDKCYLELFNEYQAIAAQNEALKDALEELMRWQVQNVKVWSNSAYDNAHRTITSLPNLAAEVLKRRDAEVREQCAKVCGQLGIDKFWPTFTSGCNDCAEAIRALNTEGGK